MASSVRNALSQENAAYRLADRTNTLRVSVDGSFSDDDPHLEAGDLSQVEHGTGAVLETEESIFFSEFGMSKAFQQTDRISINTRVKTSDTVDNSAEYFPGSIMVELHYSGDEGVEGSTWESVIMVFQPDLSTGATATVIVEDSTEFKVVGLARDAATP